MNENKDLNAKYEFLKNYLKLKPKELDDEEIDNVSIFLSEFFDSLPAKVKKNNEDWIGFINEQIQQAFARIIKSIANCPYVEIKISNQDQQNEFQAYVRKCMKDIYFQLGWIASGTYLDKKGK